MKIQPLGNRLLLEEYPPAGGEEKTASGIVLPDTAEKEKSQFAIIIALGDGKKLQKLNLKKGDKVVLEKFGPTEVDSPAGEEKKTYLLAEIDQVLAKIEN